MGAQPQPLRNLLRKHGVSEDQDPDFYSVTPELLQLLQLLFLDFGD
jgi:hypothetical protein